MIFSINLPDTYIITDNIKKLSSDEWKIYFDLLNNLIEKYNRNNDLREVVSSTISSTVSSTISSTIESTIKTSLSNSELLSNIDNQIQSYCKKVEIEINNLKQMYIELENTEQEKKTNLIEIYDTTGGFDNIIVRQEEHKNNIIDKISELHNKLSNDQIINQVKFHNEKIIKSIEIIEKNLQPIIKLTSNKSIEKGQATETYIEDYLRDNFPNSYIVNTSKEVALGDLIFLDKNICCLVEIKNKEVLTKDDIIKFERDIDSIIPTYIFPQAKNVKRSINCALFISFATNNFPGLKKKNIFFIEHRTKNIPIIYVYTNYINDIHLVSIAIDIFYNLIDIGKSDDSSSIEACLVKDFNLAHNSLTSSLRNIEILITNKKKELLNLQKIYNEISDTINVLNTDASSCLKETIHKYGKVKNLAKLSIENSIKNDIKNDIKKSTSLDDSD